MKVLNYDWNGKKVLITGASGFKGSWLAEVLIRMGAIVFGTVRKKRSSDAAYTILQLDKKLTSFDVDILNQQQVYDTINDICPDVIFHLAARAVVPSAIRDPKRTFEVNIMGTINILEACRKLRNVSKLIICSTDHVFGNITANKLPQNGFAEHTPIYFCGPYDTSKAAMELVVRSYHQTYYNELPSIGITRCANVFGYGDTAHRRVIPSFINSAMNLGKIELTHRYNGRQFIHITDVVAGYIRAASLIESGAMPSYTDLAECELLTPTFHFAIEHYAGTTEPFLRIHKIASLVANLFKDVQIVEAPNCRDYALKENPVQALNCAYTRKSLQWKPVKPFETALEETRDWYMICNQTEQRKRSLMEKNLIEIIENLLCQEKTFHNNIVSLYDSNTLL
ncbi:hypothetical protein C7N43_31710 [Sphingobacteriales bacterium UPWRP_1]|nr:hypothetical protein BVG80_01535 [Sphingobacteriales bacterium TSM_CSM]PSJ72933.1 hypothetical protein C7N43_31710 [Sphingobacteriales bacterium UPWRP_1]